MLLQVILEGIGLGVLLILVCAIGIRKGAVGMVHLYSPEVQNRCVTLGLTTHERIKRNALLFKAVYKAIIADLPKFEKADRFKMNIVNCAMIGAFILSMPALCRLDCTMSEAGGVTDFVRQYTLASGDPYCDCGYKKKGFVKAGTEAGR